MKNKSKSPSLSSTFYLVIILFLLGFLAYFSVIMLQLTSRLSLVEKNTNAKQNLTSVPKNDISTVSEAKSRFTHPTLKYSVDFPTNWKPQLFKSLAGVAVQPYVDFIIYSPNFLENHSSDQPSDLSNGASILIRVSDTPYKTIEEKFKNNAAARKIAQNIINTSINNIPAIQYDYSVDGENATNLTFIKGDFWYLIKYQYANNEEKDQFINVYKEVQDSFKFSK